MTEQVGGRAPATDVEFCTPDGEPVQLPVVYGQDGPAGHGSLRWRRVVLGEGRQAVQYRLPRSAREDRQARDRLEQGVAAAVALERAYAAEPYRDLFARPLGHNLDAAEPFVLFRPPDGEPFARYRRTLGVQQLRTVMQELALAVRLLAALDLVHRGLTPHSVRWDGRHVRIPEPLAALRAGRPRQPYGTSPWASPEQLAGSGTADPRDDLWSIARLTYTLATGRPGDPAGPPADLGAHRGLSAFRDLDLFAARAADRGSPVEVLRGLNRPDPLATGASAADPLQPGRREFDEILAAKRQARHHVPEPGSLEPASPESADSGPPAQGDATPPGRAGVHRPGGAALRSWLSWLGGGRPGGAR